MSPTESGSLEISQRIMREGAMLPSHLVTSLPASYSGTTVHTSTVVRWITKGIRLPTGEKLRLEAIRRSNRWYTSVAALERFFDRQTQAYVGSAGCEESDPRPIETPKRTQTRANAATDEIRKRHGVG